MEACDLRPLEAVLTSCGFCRDPAARSVCILVSSGLMVYGTQTPTATTLVEHVYRRMGGVSL